MVRWVESDTLLRTEDALLAEVMRECDFERRGKKIVDRTTLAIRHERWRSNRNSASLIERS